MKLVLVCLIGIFIFITLTVINSVQATDYIFGTDPSSGNFTIKGKVGAGTPTPTPLLQLTSSGILSNVTMNASNLSSGAFASNTGGGNFSFPGNVGIGTTGPAGKLDVVGNTAYSTDVVTGGTAWAGSTYAGSAAANAFDNNTATHWGNNNSLTGNNGMVGYIFGSAKMITRVRFKPQASGGWGGVNSFDVMYSDTGGAVANWTVIASDTHANNDLWGDYTFTNTTQSHVYWAIRVNTSYTASYTSIWEMEMMTTGSTSSSFIITSTGTVGVGTSSPGSYQMNINGPAYATFGWDTSSDIRLKENINPITSALDKISQLQGVTFKWKAKEFPDKRMPEGNQYGLIAQEVEKVIPEIVRTNDDGYKALNYDKLTPLLIESVKELKKEIDELSGKKEPDNKDLRQVVEKQQQLLKDQQKQIDGLIEIFQKIVK